MLLLIPIIPAKLKNGKCMKKSEQQKEKKRKEREKKNTDRDNINHIRNRYYKSKTSPCFGGIFYPAGAETAATFWKIIF